MPLPTSATAGDQRLLRVTERSAAGDRPGDRQLSPERNCDLVVPDRAARARSSAGSGGTGRPCWPGRATRAARPAGPTLVATGLVAPGGTVGFSQGPVPLITHPGPGP
jgi:hypothetical protein